MTRSRAFMMLRVALSSEFPAEHPVWSCWAKEQGAREGHAPLDCRVFSLPSQPQHHSRAGMGAHSTCLCRGELSTGFAGNQTPLPSGLSGSLVTLDGENNRSGISVLKFCPLSCHQAGLSLKAPRIERR